MSESVQYEAPQTPPGTYKSRYLLPSGNAGEFFIHGITTPEQIDNLIAQAILLDQTALDAGLLSANQTAGAAAIAGNKLALLAQKFGVREGNELMHCISIDITPAREGKSKVEFFGDNFKQPRNDWSTTSLLLTPEQLQEALAPYYEFKLATFDRPETFKTDFYVETYKSKHLNQAGNPYTNVSRGGIYKEDDAAAPERMSQPAPPPPTPPPTPPAQPEAPQEPDDIPF
jgi:hypothetical protein